MSDYLISQQRRDVRLVYRCSGCSNPVSLISTIYAVVKVYVSLLNKTTAEAAGAYVTDQLLKEIDASYQNKTLLRTKALTPEELNKTLKLISVDPSPRRLDCEIDRFSSGKAWLIMDESTFCPVCGRREVWQWEKDNAENLMQLEEDNFPKVFSSDEFVDLFINLKLQEKNDSINKARLIPGAVEKAQKELHEKQRRKQEIEETLQRGSDRSNLDSLAGEIEALNDQLRRLKAFDFSAKKSVNQQIEEKKKVFDELNRRWQQEASDRYQELCQLDHDVNDLLYLAYGTSGTAELVLSCKAKAGRLIPNDPDADPAL